MLLGFVVHMLDRDNDGTFKSWTPANGRRYLPFGGFAGNVRALVGDNDSPAVRGRSLGYLFI